MLLIIVWIKKMCGVDYKKMNKFCVITNTEKDKGYETAEYIKGLIETAGKQCVMVNDRFGKVKREDYIDAKEVPDDAECLLILGGDGTMIQAAKDFCNKDIPLLGVNLGTLGFLTEVEKQNIEESLQEIYAGNYRIEHRIMLEGKKEEKGEVVYQGVALNDIVLNKSRDCRLITLHVYVNDELMDTYVCDGLIISTPTGSTAYNLSAGGPVLTPEVRAFILTPICPHSLNKRSLVLSAQDKIVVKVGKSKEVMDDYAVVNVDGANMVELTTHEEIHLQCSVKETKIVKLTKASFYNRLRSKLNVGM